MLKLMHNFLNLLFTSKMRERKILTSLRTETEKSGKQKKQKRLKREKMKRKQGKRENEKKGKGDKGKGKQR